jgi:3-oxoacyl-[acyl-carrier protein] reductase
MDLGIQGKRAAVAASTAGLGLATAKALAEAGAEVLISGRGVGRLTEAQAQVPRRSSSPTLPVPLEAQSTSS